MREMSEYEVLFYEQVNVQVHPSFTFVRLIAHKSCTIRLNEESERKLCSLNFNLFGFLLSIQFIFCFSFYSVR